MHSIITISIFISLLSLSQSLKLFDNLFGRNEKTTTTTQRTTFEPLNHGVQNYLDDGKVIEKEPLLMIMKVTKDGGFEFSDSELSCVLSRERGTKKERTLTCNNAACSTTEQKGYYKCEKLKKICYVGITNKKAECKDDRNLINAPDRDCPPGQKKNVNNVCRPQFDG